MKSPLNIFGLSKKAEKVFIAIKAGQQTPVQISKHTGISRPAIYAILNQLTAQGLVEEEVKGKTRQWQIASPSQLNKLLEKAKIELLGSAAEKEVLYQEQNVEVKVYRGQKTIRELMKHIFQEHRGQKCIGIQGVNVYEGWKNLLGVEFVNDLNKSIKKNGLVIQAIVPEGHFPAVVETMGEEWAKHFEGRTYRANVISEKYFDHKGEVFLFKDNVYLISMSEELVIEIKHSHIQKLLMAVIEYIQESSRTVDGNEMLRRLITK